VVAPLAFNLADAFVFVGFGLVCVAVLAVASSSPLDEPVRVRR
jgi:lipoprotein signal peptidase